MGVTGGGLAARLVEEFRSWTAGSEDGLWRSPGRVNLIGDHTDYNDGLALPFAIDRATLVAARRRGDRAVRLRSTNVGTEASADLDQVGSWRPQDWESWARYPLGVIAALLRRGAEVPGMDIMISSDVPRGGGLSSSAALSVSVGTAVADLAGANLEPLEMARAAQEAEALFAGVPCGLLDQVAVLGGGAGQAVLIDFRSLSTEPVPMATGPVVVVDTCVERDNASGAYADRRATCQKAAQELGLVSLRDATLELVESRLQGELRKRARHIVTENERVVETARRLRQGDPIGELLVASHRSLRDDFEVSVPELDLAVETALANGADGSRLTGAGLGGCAISVGVAVEDLAGPVAKAFADAGFRQPKVFAVSPAEGAGRLA